MSISRNVILDLLPVYLAGEASEDTRMLIEEYLQTDKELAQMVAESNKTPFTQNIEVPVNKESEMASLEKAQAMIQRTIIVSAVALVVVCVTPLLVTAGLVYLLFLR